MKEYGIYNTQNEVIYKIKTDSMDEAINIFAFMKKMEVDMLLSLFEIKEIK